MFSLGFDKNQNCIVGVYTGMFSEEIFTACIEKVKFASEKYPCKKFALDMRKGEMIVNENIIRKIYNILYKAGLDSSWKKAVLLSNECYAEISDPKILEMFQDMKIDNSIQNALTWLKG